jgi:hypothetical protein
MANSPTAQQTAHDADRQRFADRKVWHSFRKWKSGEYAEITKWHRQQAGLPPEPPIADTPRPLLQWTARPPVVPHRQTEGD